MLVHSTARDLQSVIARRPRGSEIRARPSLSSRASGQTLQRKAQCACGGDCPRCGGEPLVQTKLALSQPGDTQEQEADRVAEHVMRMPASLVRGAGDNGFGSSEQEGRRTLIHRQANAGVHESNASRAGFLDNPGPGQPLDIATRNFFEPRFGQDFSSVRIHSDARAAESANAVNALAYTTGRDIVFAAGQYAPEGSAGRKLLAHELTHVVQQKGSNSNALGRLLQRAEAPEDPAKKVVVGNSRIDVRAQFALLRLLRGPANDAETARAMIDEIEKGSLKGIYGDDLKVAADAAFQRGKKRWELVPADRDAIWIGDGLLDAPLMFFKEAAGQFPQLDRALIKAYRADPALIKEACPDGREGMAPSCTFSEKEREILDGKLQEARDRAQKVSNLLMTAEGRNTAVAAAGTLFDTVVPDLTEITTGVNGVLAVLKSPTIKFACRTCGDPVCRRPGNVAYVIKAGQMPIFICSFRLFSAEFVNQVRRTITHEAVHLSGIDADTSKDETYCEKFAPCSGPCHGKDNAESWARYIDCLAEPPKTPAATKGAGAPAAPALPTGPADKPG
jgi:hypothetical protein